MGDGIDEVTTAYCSYEQDKRACDGDLDIY